MKKKIKAWQIAITVAALVIIIFISLVRQLTWGNNYAVYEVTPIGNTTGKITAAEKNGGVVELGEAEINGMIKSMIKENKSIAGATLKNVYAKINDNKVNMYAYIEYKRIKIIASCIGSLAYDSNIVRFTPEEFRIGRIRVPKDKVYKKLMAMSGSDIEIKDGNINISKDAIPFDFTAMEIKDNKVALTIEKIVIAQETGGSVSTGGKGTGTVSKTDLLKRARAQLNGVYSAVNSQKSKDMIRRIQSTMSKMIDNPSYNYTADVNAVKAMKAQLSSEEKERLQDAVLDNMDTRTIKELRRTFGV